MSTDPRTASQHAAPGAFPATRVSVIEAAASADPAVRNPAWDTLVRAYWRPVYTFVRLRWNVPPDDAADLTQAFFAHALESAFLEAYDPRKARFRTWLRTCLQRFLANEHKAANRQKRGGGQQHVSLDFPAAERDLHLVTGHDGLDEDAFFHREAVRSLISLAVDDLRRLAGETGRSAAFEVFRLYDLEDPGQGERPTYRVIGEQLDMPVTQVTNHLARMRREFRRILLDRLREVCGSDAEFRQEARELLGVTMP